jgi:thioredoxin-dependent peroxiredoxin
VTIRKAQARNVETAPSTALPAVGQPAPEFLLSTDTGDAVSLADYKGKAVVLYFYPKDDTSSCTVEACGFRDGMPRFRKGKAVILGISPDTVKSHRKFKEKFDLNFTLLADIDHAVAERYGVWQEKTLYGHTYMGVERTTFLIDADGVLRKVFEKVRSEGHADEVAEALAGM